MKNIEKTWAEILLTTRKFPDEIAKPRSVSLPDRDWDWLKAEAQKQDRSVSDVIRQIIKKHRSEK